jgi:TetR/AcrR family transcriptional repressor of nem operon
MGHSQAEKAESHARIVKIAAERFREAGIEGIGVADLMKEAGLTTGGFYRHFSSREDLVAEAVECALLDGEQRAAEAIARSKKPPLIALIDGYLSTFHRDAWARGCAVVALAGDVARSNDKARAAYARQVERYAQLLAGLLDKAKGKSARRQALAMLSLLVGAVAMARAVGDEGLSREILEAAGDALKSRFGDE